MRPQRKLLYAVPGLQSSASPFSSLRADPLQSLGAFLSTVGVHARVSGLMQIAQELDAAEKAFMAEGGVDSEDFRSFMAEDSGNVSSDGFFSIQVLLHGSSYKSAYTAFLER